MIRDFSLASLSPRFDPLAGGMKITGPVAAVENRRIDP
jgi:hypothetical protein